MTRTFSQTFSWRSDDVVHLSPTFIADYARPIFTIHVWSWATALMLWSTASSLVFCDAIGSRVWPERSIVYAAAILTAIAFAVKWLVWNGDRHIAYASDRWDEIGRPNIHLSLIGDGNGTTKAAPDEIVAEQIERFASPFLARRSSPLAAAYYRVSMVYLNSLDVLTYMHRIVNTKRMWSDVDEEVQKRFMATRDEVCRIILLYRTTLQHLRNRPGWSSECAKLEAHLKFRSCLRGPAAVDKDPFGFRLAEWLGAHVWF